MILRLLLSFVLVLLVLLESNFSWADEGCQILPTAKNISPLNSSLRTSLKPRLRVGLELGSWQAGECTWSETQWQVAMNKSDFDQLDSKPAREVDPTQHAQKQKLLAKFTVFHALEDGKKRFSIELPTALKPGTEYWWRASMGYRLKAKVADDAPAKVYFNEWTDYSEPTSFTTSYVVDEKCAAMPAPFVASPHSGAQTSTSPILRVINAASPGLGVDRPCKLANVEWQVSSSVKFSRASLVHQGRTSASSGNGSNHEFKIPANILKDSSNYFWRARATGPGELNTPTEKISPWTQTAFFKTPFAQPLTRQTCPGLNPVVLIRPQNGDLVSSTPTLEVATGGLSSGCRWDESAWQILDKANGDYIYQTGFTSDTNEIVVPTGKLKSGRTYIWRVKTKGIAVGKNASDVVSQWSAEGTFTVR